MAAHLIMIAKRMLPPHRMQMAGRIDVEGLRLLFKLRMSTFAVIIL